MNEECFNYDQLIHITNSHKYISFYEDANNNPNYFFDKVFEVVTSTNICEQLNMSFTDLLNLDYPTFQKIKDKILQINIEKSEMLKNLSTKNA